MPFFGSWLYVLLVGSKWEWSGSGVGSPRTRGRGPSRYGNPSLPSGQRRGAPPSFSPWHVPFAFSGRLAAQLYPLPSIIPPVQSSAQLAQSLHSSALLLCFVSRSVASTVCFFLSLLYFWASRFLWILVTAVCVRLFKISFCLFLAAGNQ